jgi:hypothetical protein
MLGDVRELMWGEELDCHDRACKRGLAGPSDVYAPS